MFQLPVNQNCGSLIEYTVNQISKEVESQHAPRVIFIENGVLNIKRDEAVIISYLLGLNVERVEELTDELEDDLESADSKEEKAAMRGAVREYKKAIKVASRDLAKEIKKFGFRFSEEAFDLELYDETQYLAKIFADSIDADDDSEDDE